MSNYEQKLKLMTIKEVCELFRITRQTLYNWTKGGLITAHRVARKVYYKPEDVERALVNVNNYSQVKPINRRLK